MVGKWERRCGDWEPPFVGKRLLLRYSWQTDTRQISAALIIYIHISHYSALPFSSFFLSSLIIIVIERTERSVCFTLFFFFFFFRFLICVLLLWWPTKTT
ncbi:hypothetical protein PanWU01x14_337250 [Parasponia andersonii]|uniref:Uncharacterized protein n=1 Tax=Parasponia andersonii TaxID=3476 RepID=A0A2P5AFM3_PARAD|nr:hypothetical protein PanWU01x14_337250 [Parasponia andersonii]